MSDLETISIRFTKKEAELIDKLVKSGKYATKSELIRRAVRRLLEEEGVW